MALCLAGMTIRTELLGVTSTIGALGLEPACYDRLLDFFRSPALDLSRLTRMWCALVFRIHPGKRASMAGPFWSETVSRLPRPCGSCPE